LLIYLGTLIDPIGGNLYLFILNMVERNNLSFHNLRTS
jgi:hypothetical protein